jgi:D-glycero-beta-D-manno-heptose 1-phosphate adenylyltransferase
MSQLWSLECQKKIIQPNQLIQKIQEIRLDKKKIVTLNGSFDLLHAGHLQIIYEASQQGEVLIVALNSDASIKQYKSPLRPIISLDYRLQMMSALSFVTYVTWFEETDPRSILNIIKPDIHVNGAEYGSHCIEADIVESNGGSVHIVKLIPGLSTSQILKKIASLQAQESKTCV